MCTFWLLGWNKEAKLHNSGICDHIFPFHSGTMKHEDPEGLNLTLKKEQK